MMALGFLAEVVACVLAEKPCGGRFDCGVSRCRRALPRSFELRKRLEQAPATPVPVGVWS